MLYEYYVKPCGTHAALRYALFIAKGLHLDNNKLYIKSS